MGEAKKRGPYERRKANPLGKKTNHIRERKDQIVVMDKKNKRLIKREITTEIKNDNL